MRKWIKALTIALCSLLVMAVGLGVWLGVTLKQAYDNPFDAFKDDQDADSTKGLVITSEGEETEYQKTGKLVNILLLGVDTDKERKEENMGERSDVMILATFDMENNHMNLLSLPRDLWVTVFEVDKETGDVDGTTMQRINTAYSKGGGTKYYGAENAMRTVEYLFNNVGEFDIPIDYYVTIDMDAMAIIADAMGGVEVELTSTVEGIGKKGETVTINSGNMNQYIRERKTSGGDYARAERQRAYIIAAAKKMQSLGAVKTAVSLYDKVIDYIGTNMTLEQVIAMAGFVQDFDLSQMTNAAVQASNMTTSSGAEVLEVDETWLHDYLLEYFYDEKTTE